MKVLFSFLMVALSLSSGCKSSSEMEPGPTEPAAEPEQAAPAVKDEAQDASLEQEKAPKHQPEAAKVEFKALEGFSKGPAFGWIPVIEDTKTAALVAWTMASATQFNEEGEKVGHLVFDVPSSVYAGIDGVFYVSTGSSLSRIEGGKLIPVIDSMQSNMRGISMVAAGGGRVVIGEKDQLLISGDEMKSFTTKDFDGGEIKEIFVDSEGTVVVLTPEAVFINRGEAFEKLWSVGEAGIELRLLAASHGLLDLVGGGKHISYDGKDVLASETASYFDSEIAVSSDHIYTYSSELISLKREGRETSVIFDPAAAKVFGITSMESDLRGRLWVGTYNGFVLLEGDKAPQVWSPGQVEGISGNSRIAVLGRGPDGLHKRETPAEMSVRGRFPGFPGMHVELCVAASSAFSVRPCETEDLPLFAADADDEGTFVISKLPPGDYDITYHAPVGEDETPSWGLLMGSSCSATLDGEVCDLGELVL